MVAKRDKVAGRVIKMGVDGKPCGVAEPGERVPVESQFLVPDKRKAGRTWEQFLKRLRGMGYQVEHGLMKACDYGAGTSRERLFLCARRDCAPVWPEPTHGATSELKPHVSAAECIDWSIACPSIFLTKAKARKLGAHRPLAKATLGRIAKGIKRYVIDSEDPFITTMGPDTALSASMVQAAYGEGKPGGVKRWGSGCKSTHDSLGTITKSGGHAVAVAKLLKAHLGEAREPSAPPQKASAFIDQANGGFYTGPGHAVTEPVSTVCGSGSHQRLVAVHLEALRNNGTGGSAKQPLGTITAGGKHHALVQCELSPVAEKRALRVAAFLIRYYGSGGQWGDLKKPISTITTRERLALVTVVVDGAPYVIVDIGLRMLTPRELFRAQGFPDEYIIDRTADGRKLTRTAAVMMVGNSVSPHPLAALARANMEPVVEQLQQVA